MYKYILLLGLISMAVSVKVQQGVDLEKYTYAQVHKYHQYDRGCIGPECCKPFENCKYYQVTQQLNDYGCSVCEPNYVLTGDVNTSGKCIYHNLIPNCVGALAVPNRYNGNAFCWACERDYILIDETTCFPKISDFLPYCKNYVQRSPGVIVCNECDSGYTVTESGVCEKTCDIENCENCIIKGGKKYCNLCEDGFIGINLPEVFAYSKCLSCGQWHEELTTK